MQEKKNVGRLGKMKQTVADGSGRGLHWDHLRKDHVQEVDKSR